MSDSKKLSSLEVVQRYHKKYLDYEQAFNKEPFDQEDLQKQLVKIVESDVDIDSDDFISSMAEIVMEKPQKRAEVNNAALKFVLFADFYLMTQEEDLPAEIKKDYDSIPIKDDVKSLYSVKDGVFVKNEDTEVSKDMKEYFKVIYKQIREQKNLK